MFRGGAKTNGLTGERKRWGEEVGEGLDKGLWGRRTVDFVAVGF